MLHGHGGNVQALARQLGCAVEAIVDMSSNVNPYGPPPGLLAHLARRVARVNALPEPDGASAVEHFAACHDLDPACVLAGNGTTQLIHALPGALALRSAAVAGPTYADYADACRQWRIPVRIVAASSKGGFLPDPARLRQAARSADALFLCNPNNPTGTMLSAAALLALAEAAPGCWLVVDESYLPFVPGGERESLLAQRRPNLIVLHSMSKIYRIPGLRIGFMTGPASAIAGMSRLALPWSLNTLALEAVCHLMRHRQATERFAAASRAALARSRERFITLLRHAPAVEPISGVAPFVLLRLRRPLNAAKVCRHLARQRILIRDCTNFEGLGAHYVRVSLKRPAANRRVAGLLAALPAGPPTRVAGRGGDPV